MGKHDMQSHQGKKPMEVDCERQEKEEKKKRREREARVLEDREE